MVRSSIPNEELFYLFDNAFGAKLMEMPMQVDEKLENE